MRAEERPGKSCGEPNDPEMLIIFVAPPEFEEIALNDPDAIDLGR
jgi:hypothetical protein